MRLALIINQMHMGGAERVVARLALSARDQDIEVQVHAVRGPGSLGQDLRSQGIPVKDWGLPRGLRQPLRLAALSLRLGQQLIQDRVDVVHGHLCEGNLVARLAGRRAHVPVACTLHTTHLLQPYEGWIEKSSAGLVHTHVAVSRAIRDLAVQQLGIKPAPQVITNGAVVVEDLAPPSRVATLGFVGRLHPDKGLDVLLEALADPDLGALRLRIAGDGPQRQYLSQLSGRLGLAQRVRFEGTVDDISQFYASVDAVIVPSRHEGLSMVALEAMAHARPVIASRVGGNPELIQHGQTGWLVKPDQPQPLRDQLRALVHGPAPTTIASAARDHVRAHFSEPRMVREHVALWKHLHR